MPMLLLSRSLTFYWPVSFVAAARALKLVDIVARASWDIFGSHLKRLNNRSVLSLLFDYQSRQRTALIYVSTVW